MDSIRSNAGDARQAPDHDCANGQRVLHWSFGWASMILFSSAIASFAGRTSPWSWMTSLLAALMGVATMRAYWKFLSETDELQQKIQLQALALACGAGVVGGLAWSQLARALEGEAPRVSFLIAGMLIVYCVGVLAGRRRYS